MADDIEGRDSPSDFVWVTIAIAFFVIGVGVLLLSIVWIASGDTTQMQDVQVRSEVVRNIGLFVFALVGFPLAVWRGLISVSQTRISNEQLKRTDEQLIKTQKQLENAARQTAATEENNLANLLEKGATLAQEAKPAKQSTGIAILRFVGTSAPLFAKEAINLLKPAMSGLVDKDHQQANEAFEAVAGISNTREVAVFANETTVRSKQFYANTFPSWVFGLTYVECTFIKVTVKGATSVGEFYECGFYGCEIDGGLSLQGETHLRGCHFKQFDLSTDPTTDVTRLISCDFSGLEEVLEMPANAIYRQCFYYADDPPSQDVLMVLGEHLTAKSRNDVETHRPSSP